MNKDRILIVEDEKIIALDLQRRLEKLNFDIVEKVSTGKDALEAALSLKPDMILMDIMLKGDIDGIEAAIEIKKKSLVPIIFLTAYADDKTLERAKKADPMGYILKPFKERELYTTITIALYKFNLNKKLDYQERLLSSIINNINDGIIVTDSHHKLQFMNPAAEKITGWKEKECHDLHISSLIKLTDNETRMPLEIGSLELSELEGNQWFFSDCNLIQRQGDAIKVDGSLSLVNKDDINSQGQIITIRDLSHIQKMTERMDFQSSHDVLTGILNRREFYKHVFLKLKKTHEHFQESGIIYFDLDQFKVVNDTFGHTAGDELLRFISRQIESLFDSDNPYFARLGGDEFCLLFKSGDFKYILSKAEELHKMLQKLSFKWNNNTLPVRASIGVIPLNEDITDIQEIFSAADVAIFMSKESGGNQIHIYNPTDNRIQKRRSEMEWVSRLNIALEEDMFELYYQPIARIYKDSPPVTEKYEILIRLHDDEGNIISPAEFIPAAERYNIMPYIDKWVIKNTFIELKRMQDAGSESAKKIFCINLSANTLPDSSLLKFIEDNLVKYNVSPSSFCFEITETTAIENMSAAIEFINSLKKLGCTFALDDFGNGFTSFAYLKNLPADYLKLDGSFVKDMLADDINFSFVESINQIGHILKMETIAEFVASEGILKAVTEIGVDFAQGYHLAAPRPVKEL